MVMLWVRTVHPTSTHEWAVPVDDAARSRLAAAVGVASADAWTPLGIVMQRGNAGGGPERRRAEAPFLDPAVLVVRDDVRHRVEPALRDFGEFLALDDVETGERLWAFNATCDADPLDESRSVLQDRHGNRVTMNGYYQFDREQLVDLGAFVLPQTGELCFTGAAFDSLWVAQLQGLNLVEVWCGDSHGLDVVDDGPLPDNDEVEAALERLCRLHLGEFGPAEDPHVEQLRAASRHLWAAVVEKATDPMVELIGLDEAWGLAVESVLEPIVLRRRQREGLTDGEAFFADAAILTFEQFGLDLY